MSEKDTVPGFHMKPKVSRERADAHGSAQTFVDFGDHLRISICDNNAIMSIHAEKREDLTGHLLIQVMDTKMDRNAGWAIVGYDVIHQLFGVRQSFLKRTELAFRLVYNMMSKGHL